MWPMKPMEMKPMELMKLMKLMKPVGVHAFVDLLCFLPFLPLFR